MDIKEFPKQLEAKLPDGIARMKHEISWPRTAAVSALLASAYLLLNGKRKGAIVAAAAAGVALAVEHPEAAKQIWNEVPNYLRQSHDFLARLEEIVGEVSTQGEKLRNAFGGKTA
jgi:hypothetical protein